MLLVLAHQPASALVVTPTWAKPTDFETTLPNAVEELLQRRKEHQHS
ncbi:hypothetical protein SAMN05444920_13147 [Nonomuraea solani]|uniref:Uncharacterized protein n=1 Tax=Nonomuraea solani TaxID=1144553 RepID=A0A1H6F1G3_9ACTN|nr:hypothetical protein SAMN05444920_13147 [Nonomuraea solani]